MVTLQRLVSSVNALPLCGSPSREKRMKHSTGALHPQDAHRRLVDGVVGLGKYTVIEAARVLNEEAAHVDMVVHGSQHPTVYRPTDSVWPVIHQPRAQTGGYAFAHQGRRELVTEGTTEGMQRRIPSCSDEKRV